MDEAIRKLLGIRRKTGWLFKIWYHLRRNISFKAIVVFVLLSIFLSAAFLFARVELANRPDLLEQYAQHGVNPYFASLYWLVTTITTVGYGDIAPITMEGKLIALGIMIMGIVTVSLLISQITSRIVSINLGSMFGVTKTRRRIDCILCGWNPITQAAYRELKGPGTEIVVIDSENRPDLARSKDLHYLAGNPTMPDTLKRANIVNAKSIILAMEEDSDVLLAIHVIRELNPWINIVAKINNHEHIKIAESAGADQIVSPPSIGGRLMSMVTEEPSAVDWVIRSTSAQKGMKLIEYLIAPDSPLVGKTLAQARKEFKGKARLIGVDTAGGLQKIPGDDLKIEAGNKLIMLIDKKRFDL